MKAFKLFLALVAVVGVTLASASPAEAVFRMRIENVGTGIGTVITDGGPGDINPATDAITFMGSLGSFTMNVITGLASPTFMSHGLFDAIKLSSTNATSGPGTLRIILEKDGFGLAPDGALSLESRSSANINAPVGSSLTVSSFAHVGNLVPTLGADQAVGPIAAVADLPPVGTTTLGGGSHGPPVGAGVTSVPFAKSGTYSLFSVAEITVTGISTASFDHTTGTNPAPAGLILLAAGVPCFVAGYFRRKKAAA